jgi:hypothetical protein
MTAMSRARAVRALFTAVLLAAALACRGPEQRYQTIAAHVSPLREQFNADAGKTRILILPAPN